MREFWVRMEGAWQLYVPAFICHGLRCASLLSLSTPSPLSLFPVLALLLVCFFICSFLAEAVYLFLISMQCNSGCNYSCTCNYYFILVHTQKAEKQGRVISGFMDQLNDERQGLFSYLYDSFPLIVLLSKLRGFQSTQL